MTIEASLAITAENVQKAYIAYFGRPADAAGLLFWTAAPEGTTMIDVMNNFAKSSEFTTVYPNATNYFALVNGIYQNLFAHDADTAGATFWVNALNAGSVSVGQVAYNIARGAQGTDVTALDSKVSFSSAFTSALLANPAAAAQYGATTIPAVRTQLAAIDTAAEATAAVSGLTAQVAALANPPIPPLSATLTDKQDSFIGTAGNDIVRGLFGGATGNTATIGDNLDGGAGTADTLELTSAGTAASPAAFYVKGFETISIKDLYGATLDALSIESAPAIVFSSTIASQTSTVTSAALASVIGLAGKGNLTATYLSSSATVTTDAASISLSGAGTSATVRSTVNVSDSNKIDSLAIATTGSNYVNLTAGSAAKLVTITGNGTNDIAVTAVGDVAAVSTIDASASTGANTVDVGANLNTTDVVKGGSGADTLSANFTLGTLVKPTLVGVETIKLDFDAAATFDLGSANDVKTVTLSGSSANQLVQKADSTVATLNVTSQATNTNDLAFSYDSASKGDLTLNIGTTATTAANFNLDQITIGNSKSLNINTIGTKTWDITNIDVSGDQSSLNISVAATSDVTIGGIDLTGDVGAAKITVAAGATYSGGLYLSEGNSIGDVTFSVAADAELRAFNEVSGGGSVGNVVVNAVGENAFFSGYVNVIASGAGDFGNITLNADGNGAEVWYHTTVSGGGDIGDITVTASNGATVDFSISGNSQWSGFYDADGAGDIGVVSITVGEDSSVSGYIAASGGSIGNVSVVLNGANASGALGLYATYQSGDLGSGEDYVAGGDIGDITLTITDGDGFNIDAVANGGDIGDIVVGVGEGAYAYLDLDADADTESNGSDDHGGNIGTITVTAAADSRFGIDLNQVEVSVDGITVTGGDGVSGSVNVSGASFTAEIADISVTLGGDSSFEFFVASGFNGIVGDVTINLGDNASANYTVHRASGNAIFGDISITVGDDSDASVYFSGASGSVGNTTITTGENSDVTYGFSGGNNDGIGGITIIGGDADSSASVYIRSGTNADGGFGGLDASAWLGSTLVDLSSVTDGTIIRVGADGSIVTGTQGSDNIFGGAGVDTVTLSSASLLDEIFAFQKAKDIVDFGAFTDNATETAIAANAAATTVTDGSLYVFAAGADGTGAEAIADYRNLTDVAEFIAAAFSNEAVGDNFVAVINAGNNAAYAYNVVANAGTGAIGAGEVTLIGIINTDGVITVANVVGS